jgi:transcriptional regulator with XRE-family HTH domain
MASGGLTSRLILYDGGKMSLRLRELAELVREKRGISGVRAAAAEVEISPATFSRIENGHMPDLETFAKICKWLEVDPTAYLGLDTTKRTPSTATVHFRKGNTTDERTAQALGSAIIAAQTALRARAEMLG